MVGTPSKMVARSRWTAASTAAGVNRGISDIVQPNRTQTSRMEDRPNTWNSGSTVMTTSSGWTSNSRPGMSAFMYSWMWVSSAPLGWPVVPEV